MPSSSSLCYDIPYKCSHLEGNPYVHYDVLPHLVIWPGGTRGSFPALLGLRETLTGSWTILVGVKPCTG